MPRRSPRHRSLRRAAPALTALLFLAACSSDDDGAPAPTATVAPTSTETAAPTGTATSLPTDTATTAPTQTATPVPTHTETAAATATETSEPTPTETATPISFNVFFGSTEHQGDQLFGDYDPARNVRTGITACLPPGDSPCDGGTAVFATILPGFTHVHSHDSGGHELVAGTTLVLEIVANPDGISVSHDGETAVLAGETVELGVTPFDHVHAEFTFAQPGGGDFGAVKTIELRLVAPGSAYAASDPFVVTLETSDHPDGHGGGNGDDEHGDDEHHEEGEEEHG